VAASVGALPNAALTFRCSMPMSRRWLPPPQDAEALAFLWQPSWCGVHGRPPTPNFGIQVLARNVIS